MESCSDICDFVLRVMLVIYFSFLALDFFVKVIHNRFWQRIFFVISYCTDVYGDTHSHTDHTCHDTPYHTCHHNITSDLTAPLVRLLNVCRLTCLSHLFLLLFLPRPIPSLSALSSSLTFITSKLSISLFV